MSNSFSLIVDLTMMGLLAGTIAHSLHLSQSLKGFKKIHNEITPLMKDHAQALSKTMQDLQTIKNISKEIDQVIASRIPLASRVKEELAFLVSRAEEMADHLEVMIKEGRGWEFQPLKEAQKLSSATQKKKNAKLSPLEVSPELSSSLPPLEEKCSSQTKPPQTESFSLTKTAQMLFRRRKNIALEKEDNHAA